MTFLVLFRLTDGVQKARQERCLGCCVSEVKLPNGKAWNVIFGSGGVAWREIKAGLMSGPHSRREAFLFRRLSVPEEQPGSSSLQGGCGDGLFQALEEKAAVVRWEARCCCG